ncbi:MAG: hypothetical protein K0R58_3931 [Ramlibacter sp.]|jgi:hypothetical protein|nr:hypothetical protein [Ramlibacter sp.]
MNRLQVELQRLYGSADAPDRAAVLELAGAGGWAELAKVWQGVQADLDLPAPGIAVNGSDAYQLWFSFDEAPDDAQTGRFLSALRARYLRDVPAARVRLVLRPATTLPMQTDTDRWSAFVTPDLAALFDQGPWLDMPPGTEAQAELLSRLRGIRRDGLERALQRLEAAEQVAATTTLEAAGGEEEDPRRFLLRVMNDPGVDMGLRIEAARALLQEGARR